MKLSKIQSSCLASLAGALLTLSFAPFNLYLLAFIALGALFYLWTNSNPRQTFFYSLLFGVFFFGTSTSWIHISIHQFGHAPLSLSIALTVLMTLLLSLFYALNGYIINKLAGQASLLQKNLLLYPSSWVLFEWLRAHALFNGFPWLLLGYTQTNTLLNSFAPWFGVFGLSLLACLISGALSCTIQSTSRSTKLLCCVATLCLFSTALLLKPLKFTHAIRSQRVVLIQGNITQSIKWQPEELEQTLQHYYQLTETVKEPSLIVWPEGAVPTYVEWIPGYIADLNQLLATTNSTLLFGCPLFDKKTQRYFNGLILTGEHRGQYRKQHLVPFGEYFPLHRISAMILKLIHMPPSGYSSGSNRQAPLELNGYKVATFICYEIAYPNLVLNQTRNKQMIVVISDDSWFGNSIALNQQLQMTTMRALETQRYVLASNNTGITAIIDPQGRVLKQAPINQTGIISDTVHAMAGNTPLMRWGYWPVWLSCLLMFLIGTLKQKRKEHENTRTRKQS